MVHEVDKLDLAEAVATRLHSFNDALEPLRHQWQHIRRKRAVKSNSIREAVVYKREHCGDEDLNMSRFHQTKEYRKTVQR